MRLFVKTFWPLSHIWPETGKSLAKTQNHSQLHIIIFLNHVLILFLNIPRSKKLIFFILSFLWSKR